MKTTTIKGAHDVPRKQGLFVCTAGTQKTRAICAYSWNTTVKGRCIKIQWVYLIHSRAGGVENTGSTLVYVLHGHAHAQQVLPIARLRCLYVCEIPCTRDVGPVGHTVLQPKPVCVVPVQQALGVGIGQKHGVAGPDDAIKHGWLVVVQDKRGVVVGELHEQCLEWVFSIDACWEPGVVCDGAHRGGHVGHLMRNAPDLIVWSSM